MSKRDVLTRFAQVKEYLANPDAFAVAAPVAAAAAPAAEAPKAAAEEEKEESEEDMVSISFERNLLNLKFLGDRASVCLIRFSSS